MRGCTNQLDDQANDLVARHSPKVRTSRNRIRKLLAPREVVQHWDGGPNVLTHDVLWSEDVLTLTLIICPETDPPLPKNTVGY